MRTQGSAQELHQRRLRAVRLVESGSTVAEVAKLVGADRRSVTRWMQAFRSGGESSLSAKPHPGRKPFLSGRQKGDLAARLLRGAQSQGFSTPLWTCPRVRELIEGVYGVTYHVDHIPRLLRSLGFSPQKPQRRASERDEQAIAEWVRTEWPRIKKKLLASALT